MNILLALVIAEAVLVFAWVDEGIQQLKDELTRRGAPE